MKLDDFVTITKKNKNYEEKNNIFICNKCQRIPSIKYIPSMEIKIRCSCSPEQEETITISDFKSRAKEESFPGLCELHKEDGEKYCVTCQKWLCQKCLEDHKKNFSFKHCLTKKKIKIDLTCNDVQCKQSENITHYCLRCKKILCDDCVNYHLDHSPLDLREENLEKFWNESKGNMTELQKEIKIYVFIGLVLYSYIIKYNKTSYKNNVIIKYLKKIIKFRIK